MQKVVILAVLAMTISGFLSNAHAQSFRLTLEQRSDTLGNTQYLVSMLPSNGFSQAVAVSPSGTRFDRFSGKSMIVSSFEEIQGELFGSWTIEDVGFGDDEIEIHNFTVEPFALDSVFSESPFVVSPSDGDTVKPSFVFDWAFQPGVDEPSGRSISTSGNVGASLEFTPGVGTDFTIDATFRPGFTSALLTIRGGSSERVDGPMSAVTTSVDSPRSSFSGILSFQNVTDSITVTIEADFLLGDVNLDGTVTFLDIAPFIDRLSSGTLQLEADIDQNGVVNFLDIGPFISLLSSQ